MIWMMMAVALATGQPAEIVNPGEEEAFDAWMRSEVAKSIEETTGTACPAAKLTPLQTISGGSPAQYLPPTVAGYAVDPVYRMSFQVEDCGPVHKYNFMILRVRNMLEWMAMPMAPGDSFASPRLQRDLWPSLLQAISLGLACSYEEMVASFRPGDTVIVEGGTPGAPWVERWPVTVCGLNRTVEISFTPTPADGGTDFAIRPAWTD